jgi:hypothetical protein
MKVLVKDEGNTQQEISSSEQTEIDAKLSASFDSAGAEENETPASETRTEVDGHESSKEQAETATVSDVRAGASLESADVVDAPEVAEKESFSAEPSTSEAHDDSNEDSEEARAQEVLKTEKEVKSISEVRTRNDNSAVLLMFITHHFDIFTAS